MKRATGKINPSSASERMSIRLRSDGHSFPPADAFRSAKDDGVEICVLTPKTQLVPRELFDAQHAQDYLAAAGLPCDETECAVWSDETAPAVAVMALGRTQAEAVRSAAGRKVRFTSPLLEGPVVPGRTAWFCRMEDLLYVKVYDDALQFAEAFAYASDEDFSFLLARLDREFEFKRFTACLALEAASLRKLLKPYFRRIVCA